MIFRFTITLFVLFSNHLYSKELLKREDIHIIMEQILKQHVEEKEITEAIVRNTLQNYIDHFDPMRIYLMNFEIAPYTNLSNEQAKKVLEQYKNNDFSSFIALDNVIKNSIERARRYRKEIEQNNVQLFNSQTISESKESKTPQAFAKNEKELKANMERDILKFIQEERQNKENHGSIDQAKILSMYEKQVRINENEYLGVDSSGKLLSKRDQENLFALHILKALTHSLDSHTTVLDNAEAYKMKLRLEKEFHGIGVRLMKKGDEVIIGSLSKDGPAAKSGQIKVNDRLIKINDHFASEESLAGILDILRDPSVSTITLVLKRKTNGKPSDEKEIIVHLKPAIIPLTEGRLESSYEEFENGIIGKIVLHMFYQGDEDINSINDVRNAIKDLQTKGNLLGLILDLRDNGGGFLNQAVKVAGLFITSGVIVVSKYASGEEQIYRDTDPSKIFDGPLVILTSRWTASAAEIVAQALQDYGVAIIVGDEHTYGKGTIQTQTVTDKGKNPSFFKVTVGKYYTVSGKTPQLLGVKADVVVPSRYNKRSIGEAFLDRPIPADHIVPLYSDSFSDVTPRLREWYWRYYAPNMQQKNLVWRKMVPILRKKSEERIANNKNYQAWLKKVDSEKEEKDLNAEFKDNDFQMEEAVNVVKDMIMFQPVHAH